MLYCCSRYYNSEKKYLIDTLEQHSRILEFGVCPVCGGLKAVLTFNDNNGKTKTIKPKKRKAKAFIDECLSGRYYDLVNFKTKYGSKNNMFWCYNSQGTIKDFNNETKGDCKTEVNIFDIQDVLAPEIMGALF